MSRPRMPRLKLPPHVHMTVSRGREYFAYHPFRGTNCAGNRVALPGVPVNPDGTPNATWWAAYRAASGAVPEKSSAGTFDALIEAWQHAPEWQGLSQSTKTNWAIIWVLFQRPGGIYRCVLCKRSMCLSSATSGLRRRRPPTICCAALSSLLSWSVPRGWRGDNPCEFVRKLKGGEPWRAWPWTAIRTLETLAASEMWWAAGLALYSGQRLGDVLSMRWSEVDSGVMSVRQEKTNARVWIPLHRDLRPVLDAIPRRAITILSSEKGRPWTKDGFKSQWQHQMACIELVTGECHGLVFHGLRKSAVVFLLEAGCSTAEVRAVTGQSLQMVEHYALDVNKRKLAAAAILKWEQDKENNSGTGFVQRLPNLVQRPSPGEV